MNKTGLTSITFRDLTVEQIIEHSVNANLDALEWGSDVHVIPGDLELAKRVKEMMDHAGLITSSYGSYYRVGLENEYSFEDILTTADILGAKDIRVWAGRKGSKDADEDYRQMVIEDSRRIARLAAEKDIRISYEYHARTLTDTPESTLELLKAVDDSNIATYWQPSVNVTSDEMISSIDLLKDYITNIHVFSWEGIERLSLSKREEVWKTVIQKLNSIDYNDDRYFILEFVKDDALDHFYEDAKSLISYLNK